MDWIEELNAVVLRAIIDESRRIALRRAVESYTSNKRKALSKLQHLKNLGLEIRRIKEYSTEVMTELVKEASDAIRDCNGHVYVAGDAEEARKIVADIVGEGRLIVKSKSITCEEIDLREYLEKERRCKVIETDLGEFIVQLRGEKPTHIINPSIHVPREEVAKTFSKLVGREISSDIPELVSFARSYLRDYFIKADVGISGANVVAAQTGTLFILENEGNARFSTNTPPVHVCVVGFEKIVPTLSDAFKIVEVLPAYASGILMSAYVSMITGPSKTSDIEKRLVYGAHGPKELHVIFLDNGRTRMAKNPLFREALYCIRCGGCLYECPVYRVLNGFFGHSYFGGIGSVWTAYTRGFDKALFAYFCTGCGRCRELCPLKIDVPKLVEALRSELCKLGFKHPKAINFLHNITLWGNPWGEPPEMRDLVVKAEATVCLDAT
ncbi:MAG: lactate utilization protein [Candidatus Nezhaarchaeota archaeon]|nr:lactate utilization protein [Candidatus Nezhaarchaeota archaeon]MCX8142403.1 lactate utilization protein [Candidatus Nezhaarchaeota archaeon]MDW8050624.1 lactate utilization protein B [Nitrososphaerota archaeon]